MTSLCQHFDKDYDLSLFGMVGTYATIGTLTTLATPLTGAAYGLTTMLSTRPIVWLCKQAVDLEKSPIKKIALYFSAFVLANMFAASVIKLAGLPITLSGALLIPSTALTVTLTLVSIAIPCILAIGAAIGVHLAASPRSQAVHEPVAQANRLTGQRESRAQTLANLFLEKKNRLVATSGYHVTLHLGENLDISISPQGSAGGVIETPPRKTENCACVCQSDFEHTFKTKPNPLCNEITKRISKYNMFAVFSLSKNLLLVPDTRTLSAEDYPHLMHLDHPKLVKVFAAALEVVDFLNEEFSHQQKQIKFHVGRAGSQTIGILHTRFEQLPAHILARS